jgi:hypothetical protein
MNDLALLFYWRGALPFVSGIVLADAAVEIARR